MRFTIPGSFQKADSVRMNGTKRCVFYRLVFPIPSPPLPPPPGDVHGRPNKIPSRRAPRRKNSVKENDHRGPRRSLTVKQEHESVPEEEEEEEERHCVAIASIILSVLLLPSRVERLGPRVSSMAGY
ncbi:hypothetical protein MKZ38_004857 [Zalerion maritima]|uniref:Uncharacterized protein n=1 Tax=Zalerion maritima TaxID=339359 RepID=A0AAD5WRC1_9PEZI|nr:hypothetical protein MKZ38_004857 [Zalerion maritima]